MPPNTPIFLLGLAVGTGLLAFGVVLGYWLSRRATQPEVVDRQQFLSFLQNLSSWTSEFSGDVDNYQARLSNLNDKVLNNAVQPREEMLALLSEIMQANQQLQERLDNAEQKLNVQTDQISSYLTEARTDGLTGLFNRRAFDKTMDELFSDWNTKGQAFSLGLIDIDHFKQINDTYGHPAGDAVLKQISNTLQMELGGSICVARYGGEEFAVLSTETLDDLSATLDRLRASVSGIEVTHEERVISVSLSGGVATVEADDKIGKLVRRADEALYAAKLGGRNRIYKHDGTICHLVTKVPSDSPAKPPQSPNSESGAAEKRVASEHSARIHERLQRILEEESRRFASK